MGRRSSSRSPTELLAISVSKTWNGFFGGSLGSDRLLVCRDRPFADVGSVLCRLDDCVVIVLHVSDA